MKKKIAALILTLVMVALMLPVIPFASADNNGKVIVHFYSGDNDYAPQTWAGQSNVRWGAYYWIDTGKVVESGTMDNQELDTEFSREVSGTVNNGRIFRINLTASETSAVKAGKKLGLIMVRSYTDNLGYLTPYWNGNTGKDLNSDRYIAIQFDGNNEFHLWIIAGDKNNYESLNSAKSAFERVQSAKFDDFNTLIIQMTKPISKNTNIQLYKSTDLVNNPEGELYKDNLHAAVLSEDGLTATVRNLNMESDFDWNADYQVFIKDVSVFRASCIKTRLYLSDKFSAECVPSSSVELGAMYSKTQTTFRLWAPISTNVSINFYKTGNELDPTLCRSAVKMEKAGKGVWEATVTGDLHGVYYTYSNYVEGEEKEVVDVYAKAVGVNGNRAMVCDMASTDPKGWADDLQTAANIRSTKSQKAVIWEIHIRDFSIAPDNGITYKGKYLAFTEKDTHIKGNNALKTGIDYLKDLGVNYVHLNPVFDFATVDEEFNNNTDYKSKQNWGYDPKNYNVPEGSYATNAERGEVRINEFKQMVMALHEAGIGVIMDVVYNHTYTSDSWFDQTVPGYYYRQAYQIPDGKGWYTTETGSFGHPKWTTNSLGFYNLSDGSGCSNETASERAMYRKYMIDSLVHWATEYHLDGFRFDLMAIHDVETMNQIRAALDNCPGGTGIMIYGEPWTAGWCAFDGTGKSAMSANADNLSQLSPRIAAFNDRIRNAVKGGNGWGNSGPETGYVQGNMGNDGENINKLRAGLNGAFYGIAGARISQSISYTTSHDNYTLWDHILYTTTGDKSPTVYSQYNSVVEKKNMLAATLIMTSKGTAFMLAGEEIARTKYGNHNSYNAQDKINAFDYSRQEDFAILYNWYKGLIKLRTEYFTSIATDDSCPAQMDLSDMSGHLQYTYVSKNTSVDKCKEVMVLVNPFASSWTATFDGTWTILADGVSFNFASTKTRTGSIVVPAYTSIILIKK